MIRNRYLAAVNGSRKTIELLETTGTHLGGTSTRAYGQFHNQNGAQIFKWDVSSVIGRVTEAQLLFYRTNTSSVVATYTSSFYSISQANSDFVVGNGNPAPSGICCNAAKKADGSGGITEAWAGSAGLQTAGVDYINTLLGVLTFYRTGTAGDVYVMNFNEAGVDLINGWILNSAVNYGLMTPSATFSAVLMRDRTTLRLTYK